MKDLDPDEYSIRQFVLDAVDEMITRDINRIVAHLDFDGQRIKVEVSFP